MDIIESGPSLELKLSMNVNRATVKDVKTSIKMINHLKNHPLKLRYNKLPGDQWVMSVFSDVAKNVLPDGESSAMGYIILLTNGHVTGELNPGCPLYWKSAKVPRIINLIMEGEILAMDEGLNIAYMIKKELAATAIGTD